MPETTTRSRYVKAKELAKFEAADEFCFHLFLLINIGAFETINPQSEAGRATRSAIVEYLEPWMDLSDSVPKGEPCE